MSPAHARPAGQGNVDTAAASPGAGLLRLLAGHYAARRLPLPPAEQCPPEAVPQPARSLLTDTGGMTAALSGRAGEPVGLALVGEAGPTRVVILRGTLSTRPLALGVLSLEAPEALPAAVRRGLAEVRLPFGTLLAEAGIGFASWPGALFTVEADAALAGWLGIARGTRLYGRTARLREGNGQALARVLEVLAPGIEAPVVLTDCRGP